MNLSEDQIPAVERLFDAHGVRYEVLGNRISFDDGPFMAKIEFDWKVNIPAVQVVLDSAE